MFELFEEDLENQIKRNREQQKRTSLLLEKYYRMKQNCFEILLDNLHIMEQFYDVVYDQELLNQYFYSLDQLQFKTTCYNQISSIGDNEIEELSNKELQSLSLESLYYERYLTQGYLHQSRIQQDLNAMDFRNSLESLKDKLQKVKIEEITVDLMNRSKESYYRLVNVLLPLTEFAISQTAEVRMNNEILIEKEKQLQMQLIYNQEALEEEQSQHQQFVKIIDSELKQMEIQYFTLFQKSEKKIQNDMGNIACSVDREFCIENLKMEL